jgi:hypothetical protein
MSKQQIKIKENVMEKIKENKISIKPKSYFILGSVLTFTGLIASVIFSIFLISIISFLLKEHGPMGDYRLSLLINSFPWWIPILAIIGLILGVWFLFKYDFSYKVNYLYVIIVFIIAIVIAGWLIDRTGIDNLWLNQGPMKGMMRQYLQNNNFKLDSDNKMNYQFKRGRMINNDINY